MSTDATSHSKEPLNFPLELSPPSDVDLNELLSDDELLDGYFAMAREDASSALGTQGDLPASPLRPESIASEEPIALSQPVSQKRLRFNFDTPDKPIKDGADRVRAPKRRRAGRRSVRLVSEGVCMVCKHLFAEELEQ